MKLIRKYVYMDSDDEFGDRFLRVDLDDIWPDFKRWALSKRPRRLIAADNYVKAVDRFVKQQERLAQRNELASRSDFAGLMERALIQAEDGIIKSLNRGFWGDDGGRGHHEPDASEFSGERWVWDVQPPPRDGSKMTGIASILKYGVLNTEGRKATWRTVDTPIKGAHASLTVFDEVGEVNDPQD